MSDYCRKFPKQTQCEPEQIGTPSEPICQPFEVCLPFGRVLVFDGQCVRVDGNVTIPDGEYGVFTVENGCIVSARPNPVFEYTPGPCAPAASPCDDSGGGSITLQTNISNLLSFDSGGRLGGFLHVNEGAGISLKGSGSAGDPLVISTAASDAKMTYIQSKDRAAFEVSGTGDITNPFVIGLVESPLNAGTYGGFTIDSYGRITGYKDAGAAYVQTVLEGPGIKVDQQAQVVTISLDESGVDAATYRFGGWDVALDLAGRVTDTKQVIEVEPQTLDPYYNVLTVNQFGSITAITPVTRTPDSQYSKYFGPNRAATSMVVNSDTAGRYRIIYKGPVNVLTQSTAADTGFIALPEGYSITIDETAVDAYGWYDKTTGMVTEIHAFSSGNINAGTHTIALVSATNIIARGYMDVSIVQAGV